jgi:hypothetical protein
VFGEVGGDRSEAVTRAFIAALEPAKIRATLYPFTTIRRSVSVKSDKSSQPVRVRKPL